MSKIKPLKNPIKTLKDLEYTYILRALKTLRWNRSKTARALGISRRHLMTFIAQYRRDGIRIKGGYPVKRERDAKGHFRSKE